jgi:hypothetical protein
MQGFSNYFRRFEKFQGRGEPSQPKTQGNHSEVGVRIEGGADDVSTIDGPHISAACSPRDESMLV